MDSKIIIGKRLKLAREKANLTPKQIYEATGISSGNLSDMENGKFYPSAKNLTLLSELYKVSTDWILKGIESNQEVVDLNEGIQDKELNDIIQGIKLFWKQSKEDVRMWFKVQFWRTFPEIEEYQKKRLGIKDENAATGA